MRSYNWKVWLVLSFLVLLTPFLWGSIGFAKQRATIYFTPKVEIASDRMYLGEIAQIEGEGTLIQDLKMLDLGPAPLPGGNFTLARELILTVLDYRGFNLDEIQLNDLTPDGIVVYQACQILDQEYVVQKVYHYIFQKFGDFPGDLKINLRRELPEIKLPIGDYDVEVGSSYTSRLVGNITLPVTIFVRGKEYTRVPVSLEVKLFTNVFVSTKPIDRLSLIVQDMVEEKLMEITQLNGELVLSPEELLGKQANRTIREGTIIVKEYLSEPILIKRNDQITLQVRYGGILVQALGKALDSGAKGEWIWVENLGSGKKVRAQVIDVGLAQVRVN